MLAQDTTNITATDHQEILCLFRMGKQLYALPVEVILRIIPMVKIMPLLQANDVVAGIINIQGALVPVVNLPRQLGLPDSPLELHTPILLVHYRSYTIGLIVDSVVDVVGIPIQTVTHPEQIIPEQLQKQTALAAMANTAQGTVFILDADRLFQQHQAKALLQVAEFLAAGQDNQSGGDGQPEEILPA
jgi:purine-binding chemotaxis protein CheW